MEPMSLLAYTGSFAALAGGIAIVYSVLRDRGSRREQMLREHLAALAGKLEKCELEKEKQASVIADLELERKKLEARLEEERRRLQAEKEKALAELERRLRLEFAKERSRLLEDCEKRVEQVARVSRSAATLFEAVKSGKIRLVAAEKTCEGIIIEPERILCKRSDGTLEAIWPEEYSVGEALVVEPSSQASGRGQARKSKEQEQ
ncbi:hypothetical protein [Pyrodictium abyssi]|uniref:DUF3552 domain-containing protein n=1 Tax=Pyrodictium abyssi TaxID=54256 RepID=A0ABN6ZS20_9CREN|nr:hypothetical protein PABY_08150 [Pyrodictium abyssi]